MDDAQVLTLATLAALFGCTAPTARRITKTPGFPAARRLYGSRRVWIRDEVVGWLAALPVAPEPVPRRAQEGR